MSANGASASDDLALSQQVDAALRECEALNAALRRARRTRLFMLLLFVLFVGGVCWVFYGLYMKVQDAKFQDDLMAQAQTRFENNAKLYQTELQLLFDQARPPIEDAFEKQVKADMPKYLDGLEKQRERVAKTLEDNLRDRLDRHYGRLLENQQRNLENEFPQFKDPKQHERMVKNIDLAIQKMVKHYYIDEMERQFKLLFDTWDSVQPAAVPKDTIAEDLLVGEMIELLKYKLAYPQGLALH